MSVALGTVFILNSIALLIFPAIGTAMHLSQSQFGLWAALAIHDTSSVVGAAAKYGAVALAIGTTVKLARALWIVPLTLGTAAVKRSRGSATGAKIQWPWFIALFVLAAVLNSVVPSGFVRVPRALYGGKGWIDGDAVSDWLRRIPSDLKEVGARPLIQGVLLWIAVAVTSVVLIHAGWISI